MRDEELKRARVSKYKKQSSLQNLFHERLEQMPGKRERAQITINTVIEHTIGNRTEFTDKSYGPFKMEVPKLSKPDMYKFLMYTLLQNNFTVLSIHAYDSTWRKFMKHNPLHQDTIALVFYIKDHHIYSIQDNHLKQIATKANQGGADNLWRYMSELKWSKRSSNYIKYQQLINNGDAIIVKQEDSKSHKPTLSTIENQVIILPEDMKIEYVIEQYVIRTNYFVEYLHYYNNGRLDGFMDHKHNMYILNNDYDIRKEICWKLFKMYKTHDFLWCNQSYTTLA